MSGATMTIDMNETMSSFIREYAETNGITESEFVLNALADAIEDIMDDRDFEESYAEYLADPVTYSSSEIMEEFGLK